MRKALDPIRGEYFRCGEDIYRVDSLNRGGDEVVLYKISDLSKWSVRLSVFRHAYEQVWKIGTVAQLLERSQRTLYRYESAGKIEKAKRYPDAYGRELRFYSAGDILDMHEMVSGIHAGRPRGDGKVVNNSLPPRVEILKTLRERFGINGAR